MIVCDVDSACDIISPDLTASDTCSSDDGLMLPFTCSFNCRKQCTSSLTDSSCNYLAKAPCRESTVSGEFDPISFMLRIRLASLSRGGLSSLRLCPSLMEGLVFCLNILRAARLYRQPSVQQPPQPTGRYRRVCPWTS